MTGMQSMEERILADAENEAGRILKEAEDQADVRLRQAHQDAGRVLARSEEEAASQGEAVLRQARSQAELILRDARLRRRRQWIDNILNLTMTRLRKLPDREYIGLLATLLEKNARPGEGVLRLNARDLAREGVQTLEGRLGEDRRIVLSQCPAELDGGFLLQYGEIQMNCGFSAMLEEKREELEDLINRILFA